MRLFCTIITLLISIQMVIAQTCGPFDNRFGVGGRAHVSGLSSSDSFANGCILLVQPDQKIVMVVKDYDSVYSFITLLRYSSNGLPDSGFGNAGKVETKIGAGYTHADAGVLQQDGKIVVSGVCQTQKKGIFKFTMARYLANGNMDSSFGQNGVLIRDFLDTTYTGNNGLLRHFSGMTLQADGKILVLEYSQDTSLVMARYLANGNSDASFGNNGRIILPLFGTIPAALQAAGDPGKLIALQDDGKIIITGQVNLPYDGDPCPYCPKTRPAFGMIRILENGGPDLLFGDNGLVIDSLGAPIATAAIVQPDKKILLFTIGDNFTTSSTGMIKRFNQDGKPDANFGISSLIRDSNTPPYAAILLPDGKFLTGSRSYDVVTKGHFNISRFMPDGSPDPGFYQAGKLEFNMDPYSRANQSVSIAMQDGKILLGGSSQYNSSETLDMVRIGDPVPGIPVNISPPGPISFCGNGAVNLSASPPGNTQWYNYGVPIAQATGSSFRATASGVYSAFVTNDSGCGVSTPLAITMNTGPAKPSITWNGTVLSTAPGMAGYQWMINGNAIFGANSQEWKPVDNGAYTVMVFDNHDCGTMSDSFNLVVLAVPVTPIGNAGIRYYPNPAYSILYIDIDGLPTGKQQAQLFDMSGRLLLRQTLTRTHNEVPVSRLPAGVYQLVIYDKSKIKSAKVMVMK